MIKHVAAGPQGLRAASSCGRARSQIKLLHRTDISVAMVTENTRLSSTYAIKTSSL